MAANHAINYSYKSCSFCIINYFEISSTVIDTPKYNTSLCGYLWMMMMMMVIMKWLCKRKKTRLYGAFGPIFAILAAEMAKLKNKVVQNPILSCYRFTVLTFKHIFWE